LLSVKSLSIMQGLCGYSPLNEIMSEIASSTSSKQLLNRLRNFYQSLEDIAILFLAPLLAVAVYFLLKVFGLEGDNAIYTIADVSFSIGLVPEEVIRTLIQFTTSRLKREEDSVALEKEALTKKQTTQTKENSNESSNSHAK
jgi:hypothetical protein